MALTLSYQTALDVIRLLRAEGYDLHEMDYASLAHPAPWVGKRWTMRCFDSSYWRWPKPEPSRNLHVLVSHRAGRVRMSNVVVHTLWNELPPRSIIWLDEHSSVVCPELLFFQMASVFAFPQLVLLGYEFCGHFARSAHDPLNGSITDDIPAITSVERIGNYLSLFNRAPGIAKARSALRCVSDHAISAPEAVLATMYSIPPEEAGYGMGPVVLNDRVRVGWCGDWVTSKTRFPDIMFSFAPLGLNYDGSNHLDFDGLLKLAQAVTLADNESSDEPQKALENKLDEIRAKVVDDNMRNRQLASRGRIVFPVTKEDLDGSVRLDFLTQQVLDCAHYVFGADVRKFVRTLDDTARKRERQELVNSILPFGGSGKASYGRM